MTTTSKFTKRDHYTALITYLKDTGENIGNVPNETAIAFYEHELELLLKKNASGSDKPTANQRANEEIKNEILDFMVDGVRYTMSEILKLVPSLEGATASKANAMLTQLKNAGSITRLEKKRKAYFVKGAYVLEEGEVEKGA